MYRPPVFREDRIEVMHDLIRSHPFATLVISGADGLSAAHVPLILIEGGEFGILQGHLARPNPLWTEFDPATDVLAIFQGAQHYVTPAWYPSKAAHGKVVPTWNYDVVHAYGPLTVREEADWLLAHLNALTDRMEADQPTPWAVADAPDEFVQKMVGGIVGFEIPVSRIEGKSKMSQNRNATDREGVVDGLQAEGTDAAAQVARRIPD